MNKNLTESIKAIILGLILSAGIVYAAPGFTPPTGPPATYNALLPVNVGSDFQQKIGSLQLGNAAIAPLTQGQLRTDGKLGVGMITPLADNHWGNLPNDSLQVWGKALIGNLNAYNYGPPVVPVGYYDNSLIVQKRGMFGNDVVEVAGNLLGGVRSYYNGAALSPNESVISDKIFALSNFFHQSDSLQGPLPAWIAPGAQQPGDIGANRFCVLSTTPAGIGSYNCTPANYTWPTASSITIPNGLLGQTLRYNPANVLEANSNIFNNPTNNRVGIGTATPNNVFQVAGFINFYDDLKYSAAIGKNALSSLFLGIQDTAVGYGALLSNNSGNQNTAIGMEALKNNTGGSWNTASGTGALHDNTGGNYNTASGVAALNVNTTGNQNTASGYDALHFNNGDNNTASGVAALRNNGTGSRNTASGMEALRSNSTGSNNTANGSGALYTNNASDNTATGVDALRANSSGVQDVANGKDALKANTTGGGNTATGYQALIANTTGGALTGVGALALSANTTGIWNTAVGSQAMNTVTTGGNNTAIGADADVAQSTTSNSIALGKDAIADSNEFALSPYVNKWKFGNPGISYFLPTTDGTNGQVLTTNGNHVLSFATPAVTPNVTTDTSIISNYGSTTVNITAAGGLLSYCSQGPWSTSPSGGSCSFNWNGGWPVMTVTRDISNKRFCALETVALRVHGSGTIDHKCDVSRISTAGTTANWRLTGMLEADFGQNGNSSDQPNISCTASCF